MDPEKLKAYLHRTFGMMQGAMVSALIYLGDRLELFKAMDGAGALTSAQLADRTGLHERWLREWLQGMGAAGLLEFRGEGRFELSEEGAVVLAQEGHPACGAGMFGQLPSTMAVLEQLPESFRTGIGLPYDALGIEGARAVERGFAPWYRNFLVPVALPRLEGVVEKLERGVRVGDVGCGAGAALFVLAEAFPQSEYHGYDVSKHAIDRAEASCRERGLTNVQFHDVSGEVLPSDGSYDLMLTFDCLHDMTRPQEVMASIRKALRDDGTWFIADIKSRGSYEANVEKNPMAAMMFGFSVLTCLSSSLSEEGGAGLGTLGLPAEKAEEMSVAAGFTRFRTLEINHPVNAFYEVRP